MVDSKTKDSGDEVDDCLTQLLEESKGDDNVLARMAEERKVKERGRLRPNFNGRTLGSQVSTNSDIHVKQLDISLMEQGRGEAKYAELEVELANLKSRMKIKDDREAQLKRTLEQERARFAETVDVKNENEKRLKQELDKVKESQRSAAAFEAMNSRVHSDKSLLQKQGPGSSTSTGSPAVLAPANTNCLVVPPTQNARRRTSVQAGLSRMADDIPLRSCETLGAKSAQNNNNSTPGATFPNAQSFYGSNTKRMKFSVPNSQHLVDSTSKSNTVDHEMQDEAVQTAQENGICGGRSGRRWALTGQLCDIKKGNDVLEISCLSLCEAFQLRAINTAASLLQDSANSGRLDGLSLSSNLGGPKRLTESAISPSSFLTPTSQSPFSPRVMSTTIKGRKMPSDNYTEKVSRWTMVLKDYTECLERLTQFGIALSLLSQEDSPSWSNWNPPKLVRSDSSSQNPEESLLISEAQDRGCLALAALTDLASMLDHAPEACDVLYGVDEEESMDSSCSQMSESMSLEYHQDPVPDISVPMSCRSDSGSGLAGDPNIQQSSSISLSFDSLTRFGLGDIPKDTSFLVRSDSVDLIDILFTLIRADSNDEALLIDHVTDHNMIIRKVFEVLTLIVKSCSKDTVFKRLQEEFSAPSRLHSVLVRLISRPQSCNVWLSEMCHFFAKFNTVCESSAYSWLCNVSANCCLEALISRVNKQLQNCAKNEIFHSSVILNLMELLSNVEPIMPDEQNAWDNIFTMGVTYCRCTKLAVTFITHLLLKMFPPRSATQSEIDNVPNIRHPSVACLQRAVVALDHLELRHAALEPERCDEPMMRDLYGTLWRAQQVVTSNNDFPEDFSLMATPIFLKEEWVDIVEDLGQYLDFIRTRLRLHSCV